MIHGQVLTQFLINYSNTYLVTVCCYCCICFSHIWLTQDFPSLWKTTLIIPVPKLGKVLSDPGSYRPIALTSCLCKTMEQMVNSRLTLYLELHIIIT